jgi:DNA-binding CsgD family transcriptional regulator
MLSGIKDSVNSSLFQRCLPVHNAIVAGSQTYPDLMRFWLMSGMHKFGVDPRRRLGERSRAKQLLTQEQAPAPAPSGAWELLASTLDRHTVLGGMTELSAEERRIVTLAYLEGRTNREIAAAVGISIGTVRRRLRNALAQLDSYLGRTGTWILAILVLGGGLVLGAGTRLGRTAIAVRPSDWTYTLASAAAVGAVTAVAIGWTPVSPGSGGPETAPPPEKAHAIAAPPSVAAWLARGQRQGVAPTPGATTVVAVESHDRGRNDNANQEQAGADHPNNGQGNQGLALGHAKQPPGHSSDQASPSDQPVQE